MRARALFVVAALACGALFFASVDRLWPMLEPAGIPSADDATSAAEQFWKARDQDLSDFVSATDLRVERSALRYVEQTFGRDRARSLAASGRILTRRVRFQQQGNAETFRVDFNSAGAVVGWERQLQDDASGGSLSESEARALARRLLPDLPGEERWMPEGRSEIEREERRDWSFRFERELLDAGGLKERLLVTIAGERAAQYDRTYVVPPAALRAERSLATPATALESLGFLLVAIAAAWAFVRFLSGLRDGAFELRATYRWPLIVLAGLALTHVLDSGRRFAYWDPLQPRWLGTAQGFLYQNVETLWILVILLAFVGAGMALDRDKRGRTLSAFGRGRWNAEGVAEASLNGFLVGMICGGVLAGGLYLLSVTLGTTIELQPRGFFLYVLNSDLPLLTSLGFFLGVALTEELGYRYFGGNALIALTGKRWVAILIPAVLYGMTHTRLDFLPPAEPWFARALLLTAVGCVWGWAYFRFDALTVVLSHFAADLFIFNAPLLMTGPLSQRLSAAATVALPLLPATAGGLWRLSKGKAAAARST